MNILQSDEAKSKGGLWAIGGNIGGQATRVGRGSASLIILSYYLSFFINTDLTLGMLILVKRGTRESRGHRDDLLRPRISVAHLAVFFLRTNPDTC